MPLDVGSIQALVETFNAPEIARRREYYDYLLSKGDSEETFEEHLAKYSQIIRVGETTSDAELAALEAALGRPLPDDLREFYKTVGQLRSTMGPIEVPSARELLRRLALPEEWSGHRIRSLGLVDMIVHCWGGDRWEFRPESGLIKAEEIERLNARYAVFGWLNSDPGLEGHHYLYFDEAGRFGTVFFHQEDFDRFYAESLGPMQERSPAKETLSELLVRAIEGFGARWQQMNYDDDWDDDEPGP